MLFRSLLITLFIIIFIFVILFLLYNVFHERIDKQYQRILQLHNFGNVKNPNY